VAIKSLLKKILGIQPAIPVNIEEPGKYLKASYSQEGEDCVLMRYFEHQLTGFYIDVGAHHPFRFSNTYLFYQQGWSGINIDAMPGSMLLFEQLRPRDINLEMPISETKQKLTYYVFNEPALNTFSKEEADRKDGYYHYKLQKKIELDTYPLSEVLDKFLPEQQEIDFISIDVEGLDFEVIKSNDWNKYRPKMILIESLRSSIERTIDTDLYKYLDSQGYRFEAKTFNTLFFKLDK